MVGDTSDYVKLISIVKKKVRIIRCNRTSFSALFRKLSKCRRLSSSLGLEIRARKMVQTLTTIRRFAAAT